MTLPERLIRAPGKLVLVGEYAVLDGAGAIVAAVDRGVQCGVFPGAGVETPGDDRFARAALEGAPAGRYVFRDWNPVILSGKPGFGGSAAATVAATLAAGLPPSRAAQVHTRVQGSGSGVDIHASLRGGVTRFPDGAALPAPLMIAVWSGRSASTAERVTRYEAWRDRTAFVEESRKIVDSFASDPVTALREAYRLLQDMAQRSGVAYDTAEHAAIAALARARGGAAKPSGAGGGDVAVAIFPDAERLSAFAGVAAAAGFTPIRVHVAPAAGAVPVQGWSEAPLG